MLIKWLHINVKGEDLILMCSWYQYMIINELLQNELKPLDEELDDDFDNIFLSIFFIKSICKGLARIYFIYLH